jgi:hypothetical protein
MTAPTDSPLERIREYRRAARMAVQADDHRFQDRCLALIDLAEAARAEPDLLVRTWSERAIWEESKAFLGMDDEEHSFPPEPFERAQRRLRAEGYSTCPTCRSNLATDIDFERWHQQREDHAAELRRREGALG